MRSKTAYVLSKLGSGGEDFRDINDDHHVVFVGVKEPTGEEAKASLNTVCHISHRKRQGPGRMMPYNRAHVQE